jgi:conjugal transfer pilus assembly protein TraA
LTSSINFFLKEDQMNLRILPCFARNLFGRAGFAVLGLMLSVPAFAGTSGTEFQGLYNLVKGWSEGYLGRALAIGAFLVGAIVGFAKSTAMPALVGVIFALLFAIGPGIIEGIASALI